MISIVIPTYNQWQHTHQLLFDIYKNFSDNVEVVVVDDCSGSEEVVGGLKWWGGLFKDRLKVVTPEENLGFLKSSNLGVSRASGEHIILMNNDVRVGSKSVEVEVINFFKTVEPFTLGGAAVYREDTGWNKIAGCIFPYVAGWMLLFRKEDWDRLGGFDERYYPYDFEDVDLSTTFIFNGGKLVELPLEVLHLGGQSYGFSPAREMQTVINQKKFSDKWIQG